MGITRAQIARQLLAEGGSMKPGPALSQTLGPAGINISEVIKKVNEATSNFKGMKVPVELDIDAKTKAITVNVFSPPVSELVKKELGIESQLLIIGLFALNNSFNLFFLIRMKNQNEYI